VPEDVAQPEESLAGAVVALVDRHGVKPSEGSAVEVGVVGAGAELDEGALRRLVEREVVLVHDEADGSPAAANVAQVSGDPVKSARQVDGVRAGGGNAVALHVVKVSLTSSTLSRGA
jgi:hypothetical protein